MVKARTEAKKAKVVLLTISHTQWWQIIPGIIIYQPPFFWPLSKDIYCMEIEKF